MINSPRMSPVVNRDEVAISRASVGMTAEVKNLYREDYYSRWEEWSAEELDTDSEPALSKFALIVRREMDARNTQGPAFFLHSIKIHSPLLKEMLRPIFTGYQHINTDLERLEFSAPFHEFYYRWSWFMKAEPAPEDKLAAEHYKLLFNVMNKEIRPHIDHFSDLQTNGVISFDYVWALFHPGEEIYSRGDGHDRLCLLTSGDYVLLDTGRVYRLSCRYIDTDGVRFGYRDTHLDIPAFGNLMPMASLNVLPGSLYYWLPYDYLQVRQQMKTRGRKFAKLREMSCVAYSGVYELVKAPKGVSEKQFLKSGKVMIDCSSFHRYTGDDEKLAPLNDSSSTARGPQNCGSQGEAKTMSDDIDYQDDYKQIIWAFVDSQLARKDNFDDVIKGKGKGIIMLLSGDPGVGKTLTSESVAETMQRPLYSMSAGDLGDDPSTFESNLVRVLELSTRWGAILVIDECDVFLEERTSSDLARNKLVSVLLRKLEYFRGVMFLTTNRVAAFDPAFESRIHLTIHYPKLDVDSRRHIWRTFVKPDEASYTSAIREADLDKLAQTELNGRQIKNVVQTSRLLAARDKSPLSMDHIAVVLRVKTVNPADIASTQLPDKPSTGRYLSNYAWGLLGRYL
ncbi:hypothetical protein E8E14_004277 [Neopestalotiopsis sp. 37M]|nr:hypothetical protein E8E14_004277 [Neopestalotiopsis sp. 37M]